jgi:hypothetical protein
MLPLLSTMRLCSWPWASTRRNRTSRWFWPWTRLTITPMADPQPHVATMSGTCWAGKLLCHFHIKFCIYHCLLLNLRCNGIFAVQELSPFGGGGAVMQFGQAELVKVFGRIRTPGAKILGISGSHYVGDSHSCISLSFCRHSD